MSDNGNDMNVGPFQPKESDPGYEVFKKALPSTEEKQVADQAAQDTAMHVDEPEEKILNAHSMLRSKDENDAILKAAKPHPEHSGLPKNEWSRLTHGYIMQGWSEAFAKMDFREHEDPMITFLKGLTSRIKAAADANGHYDARPEPAPLLMHIVKETAEASTAMLKHELAYEPVMDTLLKQFHTETFEKTVKNTAGDEFADIIILAVSIAKYYNVPIEKHLLLKMQYNENRKVHSLDTKSYSKS